MDIMEIVLLAAGGVIFILSFFIPSKKGESSGETKGLVKEEIKAMVSDELAAVRGHVDEVVEEAVTYSIEKTERSLERLSNEKIMAVNEYSDTVLAEIHKNHEEVMFLYDMLNNKHTSLKNMVSEVNRTVKEAAETKREAEEMMNSFQRFVPETAVPARSKTVEDSFVPMASSAVETVYVPAAVSAVDGAYVPTAVQSSVSETSALSVLSPEAVEELKILADVVGYTPDAEEQAQNCNDKILELYTYGKSNVEIAKELNLGVGEVKLVIDLYKNRSETK